MENFSTQNYTPYLGTVFAILTFFSILVTNILVKDKKVKNKPNLFELIAYITLTCTFVILCIDKDSLNIVKANALFGISLFFYILHIELLMKYFVAGRTQEQLYKPFIYIKVPIQLSLACGIMFLSIWSKNIFAIIFSIIFGLIYTYNAYKFYVENYAQNTKNNAENKKHIGKKIK